MHCRLVKVSHGYVGERKCSRDYVSLPHGYVGLRKRTRGYVSHYK